MKTLTITKEAWNAHALDKEYPSFNEAWNKAKKLGSTNERGALRRAEYNLFGLIKPSPSEQKKAKYNGQIVETRDGLYKLAIK